MLDDTQIRGYSLCRDVIADSRLGFHENKSPPRKILKMAGIFGKSGTKSPPHSGEFWHFCMW